MGGFGGGFQGGRGGFGGGGFGGGGFGGGGFGGGFSGLGKTGSLGGGFPGVGTTSGLGGLQSTGSTGTGTNSAGGLVGTVTSQPGSGLHMSDITDGLSNTIMVIEGGSAVPWTKPEDLPFTPPPKSDIAALADNDMGIRLPALGGAFKDVIHAAFGDGSVVTIKRNFDKTAMAAAITRNGGEQFDRERLTGSPSAANPKELREENEQLRQDVEETRAEIEQLKERLQKAKLERQRRAEKEAAAGDRLRKEGQKLRQELEALRDEARQLREEIERLQGGSEKSPKRR
jgi:hypothetical protein